MTVFVQWVPRTSGTQSKGGDRVVIESVVLPVFQADKDEVGGYLTLCDAPRICHPKHGRLGKEDHKLPGWVTEKGPVSKDKKKQQTKSPQSHSRGLNSDLYKGN